MSMIKGKSSRNKTSHEEEKGADKKGCQDEERIKPERFQERLERRRTGPQQYTIALCLLFSTSSSFRFRADSVSDLELMSDFTSCFVGAGVLLVDSTILLLVLVVVGRTCTEPFSELLVL